MKFKGRNIVSISDFSKEEILYILQKAKYLEENPQPKLMDGKLLATLFYEPSTRTKLSFESAMYRLGGNVTGFASAKVTSGAKGESLYDSIKIISGYSDVIVMRHPVEGAARLATEASEVPIINGGDGANQHPTQTFLDLYTIQKLKGEFDGLTVGFLGDLKYGRTVHSLAQALSHFDTNMIFIAPKGLEMPEELVEELKRKGIPIKEEPDLKKAVAECDILYNTRIQAERFPDELEYKKVKGVYKLDGNTKTHFKEGLRILHPLPRVDELAVELDSTEHAAYFEQAKNGVPVRQALLSLVTGVLE